MDRLFKTIETIIMLMTTLIGIGSIIVGVIFEMWMCFVASALCIIILYVYYLENTHLS